MSLQTKYNPEKVENLYLEDRLILSNISTLPLAYNLSSELNGRSFTFTSKMCHSFVKGITSDFYIVLPEFKHLRTWLHIIKKYFSVDFEIVNLNDVKSSYKKNVEFLISDLVDEFGDLDSRYWKNETPETIILKINTSTRKHYYDFIMIRKFFSIVYLKMTDSMIDYYNENHEFKSNLTIEKDLWEIMINDYTFEETSVSSRETYFSKLTKTQKHNFYLKAFKDYANSLEMFEIIARGYFINYKYYFGLMSQTTATNFVNNNLIATNNLKEYTDFFNTVFLKTLSKDSFNIIPINNIFHLISEGRSALYFKKLILVYFYIYKKLSNNEKTNKLLNAFSRHFGYVGTENIKSFIDYANIKLIDDNTISYYITGVNKSKNNKLKI